jgi:uroporphyrinogen decarboxylase
MQNSILLDTLNGKKTSRPPMWFMRQAGRVLPSYNKLKENYTFWQLMKDPKLAAEVTLLPVYDLGVDAAILFSDILVIPYAMGMGLDFTDKGPVFETPLMKLENPVEKLNPEPEKLGYIYDAIDEIIKTRPNEVPLIGFCGAPLTVLSYMIQGPTKNHTFDDAVKFIYSRKKETVELIDRITDLSIVYAQNQVKHGISAFQLFETHAGLIPTELYKEMFFPSIKRIAAAMRETNTPFIFFPKGISTGLASIDKELCDFVSIDWQMPLSDARKMVSANVGLQGNIDPRLLFADKKTIEKTLESYLPFGKENFNWILNFGHGFMPETPFENAKFICDWVKNVDWGR